MFLRKDVIEHANNTCPEEVETVFICLCAQNMTFLCQSLTEDCLVSLSDLVLTIKRQMRG